jgi:hypothetical protein
MKAEEGMNDLMNAPVSFIQQSTQVMIGKVYKGVRRLSTSPSLDNRESQ